MGRSIGFLSIALDAKRLKIIQLIAPTFVDRYDMILGHKNLATILECIQIQMKKRLFSILLFGEVNPFAATDMTANTTPLEGLKLKRSHIDRITLHENHRLGVTACAQFFRGEDDEGQNV